MASVSVVPYSEAWPAEFARLAAGLRATFGAVDVAIEHIGSTAVPGLPAKPVIDVLVGAASLAAIESRIPALVADGFEYVSRYEVELPQRRYFVRSLPGRPRAHVHAVERGGDLWQAHLRFRDRLRGDPATCAAYAALKLRLAREHADDKAAYTAAKGPFIAALLAAG